MSIKPDVASKERNEYIPTFITKKPFWVPDESSETDYLDHQRLKKAEEDSKWYDRGKRKGPAATKYRKGACENCGAMTHKAKECLSRPRAKGAKWTGKNIQADEVVQTVQLGYDAKRDRWNGYDASEYSNVIKEYEELEKLKRQAAAVDDDDDDDADTGGGEGRGEDETDDREGMQYPEESDMGRQQSTATRNLRLREDTAKYLINLDVESARYDPKTRSMLDKGAVADDAAAYVEEDNFMRASGDAAEFKKAQRFAWEAQEKMGAGQIHLQANPTAGAVTQKKEAEELDAKREAKRKELLEKYGDQKAINPSLRNTAIVESDRFVEYDKSGAVKGKTSGPAMSKYAEDVYTNNHTSVWGSWWQDFQWGYACCHSTIKNSYCTGDMGKRALEEEERQRRLGADVEAAAEGNLEKRPLVDAPEHGIEGEASKKQRVR